MRPARPLAVAAACTALVSACTSGPHPSRVVPSPGTTGHTASAVATSPTRSDPSRPPAKPRTESPAPPRSRSALPRRASAARLPLHYSTGAARQVLTVVASATSDTEGTLRAWRRVPGGWRPVGPAVHAWLGSAGMTPHPSESLSAVPMGSHRLTQAFGRDPDPGTALPYRQTTPADWWISQAGPYYNTEQHCVSDCPFTLGAPNEHLYYEVPYYDYAVVIDYNRHPVRQGAGSAFFLHVAVGEPTQGCVAVDRDQLVRILRWLRPAAHPRILIGTT